MQPRAAILLIIPFAAFSHPCESCHPKEVKSYARTGMGRSLHASRAEPDGGFEHDKSKTSFLIRSNKTGLFQRMTHAGENWDYRIDYVIGSGNHASCYVARVGDHLFQSPICFYKSRGYDMAPGYEDNPAPGFSRPITVECLQCHSGRPLHIANSVNRYATPAFAEEAISCDRCHGDAAAHINRPSRGSIMNPRKLTPALRDSVCEQCHLAGAVRVLNPGKTFTEFRPGLLLEAVFTTYVAAAPEPFKVVSHAEQLARSRCSLESKGRMWCGTCHNPHSENTFYREQCLSCHTRQFRASHPPKTSDCLPCHMPKREADDGGHTAFTDHWIKRHPSTLTGVAQPGQLIAWRAPHPDYRARNLALALGDYKLLLETQKSFPADPAVLSGLGTALQARGDPRSAAKLFERVIELRPFDPVAEENAGMAWLEAGEKEPAARHFEKALALDPLLLPDIEALQKIYRETGDQEKESALMNRVRQAMQTRAK
jgi:hypothetical protein